jgi:hypothetical protein
MRFKSYVSIGFAAGVLLFGKISWAQTYETSRITVLVNDSASVKAGVLKRAETEASRLFRPARIEIRWVRCGETAACRRPPRADEFVLHIVPNGKTHGDFVFGEAFLGPDGRGKYVDVFFDRVREIQDINTGALLGAVAAHELGHLLLGSGAHSLTGLMVPIWRAESLRKIGIGNLAFTTEQKLSMRNRLADEKVAVTSLTEPRTPK